MLVLQPKDYSTEVSNSPSKHHSARNRSSVVNQGKKRQANTHCKGKRQILQGWISSGWQSTYSRSTHKKMNPKRSDQRRVMKYSWMTALCSSETSGTSNTTLALSQWRSVSTFSWSQPLTKQRRGQAQPWGAEQSQSPLRTRTLQYSYV